MGNNELLRVFETAGLRRNSGCLREYAAGKVIIGDYAQIGEVEYEPAIVALVEYLNV